MVLRRLNSDIVNQSMFLCYMMNSVSVEHSFQVSLLIFIIANQIINKINTGVYNINESLRILFCLREMAH